MTMTITVVFGAIVTLIVIATTAITSLITTASFWSVCWGMTFALVWLAIFASLTTLFATEKTQGFYDDPPQKTTAASWAGAGTFFGAACYGAWYCFAHARVFTVLATPDGLLGAKLALVVAICALALLAMASRMMLEGKSGDPAGTRRRRGLTL